VGKLVTDSNTFALYNFDEADHNTQHQDSSANQRHLTSSNIDATVVGGGPGNFALYMDRGGAAPNSRAGTTTAEKTTFWQGPWSISFWVQPHFTFMDGYDGGNACVVSYGATDGNLRHCRVQVKSDGSWHYMRMGPGAGEDMTLTANGSINDMEWVHLAVTCESGTVSGAPSRTFRLYKNGTLDITSASHPQFSASNGTTPKWHVGTVQQGNFSYLQGGIAAIRISNKLRDASEIQADYRQGALDIQKYGSSKQYWQRVYDTGAGWCYYSSSLSASDNPLAAECTPNHTNNIVAGSYSLLYTTDKEN
jgi:hypothetical protein